MWLSVLLIGFTACLPRLSRADTPLDDLQIHTLNETRVRIGDGTGDPKPIGVSWTGTFLLSRVPRWSSLSVEATEHSPGNPVLVNDETIGNLQVAPSGGWCTTRMRIPPAQLRLGTNTLEIRSGIRRDNYDDFTIRNVSVTTSFVDPPVLRSMNAYEGLPGETVFVEGTCFTPDVSRIYVGDAEAPSLILSTFQAVFRVPTRLPAGVHPVTVHTLDAVSLPVELTIREGPVTFLGVSLSDGKGALAGDVSPRPGTDGRLYGDGAITIGDVLRLLRKALGLETGPWP